MFEKQLDQIEEAALSTLEAAQDDEALQSWKVAHLGRSSPLMSTFDRLREVPKEQRPAIGRWANEVKKALESLNREWEKLVKDGVTEEELADAKVNMKNNLIYRIDRKGSRANNMAYYELIGYNYRFILDLINEADNIALDKINSFVREKFTDDKKFVSIVGKK